MSPPDSITSRSQWPCSVCSGAAPCPSSPCPAMDTSCLLRGALRLSTSRVTQRPSCKGSDCLSNKTWNQWLLSCWTSGFTFLRCSAILSFTAVLVWLLKCLSSIDSYNYPELWQLLDPPGIKLCSWIAWFLASVCLYKAWKWACGKKVISLGCQPFPL